LVTDINGSFLLNFWFRDIYIATGSSSHCVVYRGEHFSDRIAQRFEFPAVALLCVPRPHTRVMESMTAIVLAALSHASTLSNSVSRRCALSVNSISITPHFFYW
jgi:hypothetical protein